MIDALLKQIESHWPNRLSKKITRFEVKIPSIDFSELLSQVNPDYFSVYWKDRDSDYECLGMETAVTHTGKSLETLYPLLDNLQESIRNESSRYRFLGGNRFNENSHNDTTWEPIYAYRYLLPRLEYSRHEGSYYMAIYCQLSNFNTLDEAHSFLKQEYQRLSHYQKTHNDIPLIRSIDKGNKDLLIQTIETAISELQSNSPIQKVVLASKHSLEFEEPTNPLYLASLLLKAKQSVFRYIFKLSNQHFFFGASPESLFSIKNDHFYSESIAGTRARGYTDHQDKDLENDLLQSEKDIIEHRHVHTMITTQLERLTGKIFETKSPTVLKLAKLQHLLFQYSCPIHTAVPISLALKLLHPTPAIVGYPQTESQAWVNQHEQYIDRGLYSGCVGWISPNNCQMTVSIRSMLYKKNFLHVFAGAGIINSSNPEEEYNEIQLKINSLISDLYQNLEARI